MKALEMIPIGIIHNDGKQSFIEFDKKFRPALKTLNAFGHINVIWWFDMCDTSESRSVLQTIRPYKNAPEMMGIFATRSPQRPNPIALTTCQVLSIDENTGIIKVTFIDAEDGSPVLDIKPYTPSFDRVENPKTPEWCSYWPKSIEESGFFDWGQVFEF